MAAKRQSSELPGNENEPARSSGSVQKSGHSNGRPSAFSLNHGLSKRLLVELTGFELAHLGLEAGLIRFIRPTFS